MTATGDNGASIRLRDLVSKRYEKYKKFQLLELDSGISSSKWKNFFYVKQDATLEMLLFWGQKYPDDAQWLFNGFDDLMLSNNPFKIDFPTLSEKLTLQQRLKWVISEWCSQAGTKIFKFLEEKSLNQISATDWLNMVLGVQKPSLQMIEFVCVKRPHFTCWILLGFTPDQIDPTSKKLVEKWSEESKTF